MLKLKDKPKLKAPSDATFESPEKLQKIGIDMLIALNVLSKTVLVGPEVGIDMKIMVLKEKPNFLYNPKLLQTDIKDSILTITYQDYQGNQLLVELPSDTEIEKAVFWLTTGISKKHNPKGKGNAN